MSTISKLIFGHIGIDIIFSDKYFALGKLESLSLFILCASRLGSGFG